MTAKEILQSYQEERKEMMRLKAQIAELRDLAENTTVEPTRERVQTSGSRDRLGDITSRMADMECEVMDMAMICLDKLERVENLIIQINDADERLMLQDRYVSGLSWRQIEHKYHYEHSAVMKKHSCALSELGTKVDILL